MKERGEKTERPRDVASSAWLGGSSKCLFNRIYGINNLLPSCLIFSAKTVCYWLLYLTTFYGSECVSSAAQLRIAPSKITFESGNIALNFRDTGVMKLQQLSAGLSLKSAPKLSEHPSKLADGLALLAAQIQPVNNKPAEQGERGIEKGDLSGIPTHELVWSCMVSFVIGGLFVLCGGSVDMRPNVKAE